MFWGLIMEPGKKYSQTVEKSFHVSQAALDLDSAQTDPVQVLLGFENRNYLLCTLQKGKWVQVPLDLNFQIGDKVSFATNGPGHVHLTGYLVPEDDLDLMEDDEDEEEEEDEEIPNLVNAVSKKRKASDVNKKEQNKGNKKTKTEMLLDAINDEESDDSDDSDVNLLDILDGEGDAEEDEEEAEDEEDDDDNDDDDDDDDMEEEDESEEEIQKPQKSPKKETPKQNGVAKKQEKTPKQDKMAAGQKGQQEKTPKGNKSPQGSKDKTPTSENKSPKKGQEKTPGKAENKGQKESGQTPQKKTIEGGVMIEDLKVGNGPLAKTGKIVQVYYEGRLKSNNKMFDSAKDGNGFKFRLGRQEVIKGWDIGLAGMKVGGKRRIICPPSMAYGAKGSPPVIPPQSTLVFEVELKQVK